MCTSPTVLWLNPTGSQNIYIFFWQTPKGTALECVKLAIDVGYRHFDGALVYFNEHEVGQAIREKIADGTVRREDIFYCGKVGYRSTIVSFFSRMSFVFHKACIGSIQKQLIHLQTQKFIIPFHVCKYGCSVLLSSGTLSIHRSWWDQRWKGRWKP